MLAPAGRARDRRPDRAGRDGRDRRLAGRRPDGTGGRRRRERRDRGRSGGEGADRSGGRGDPLRVGEGVSAGRSTRPLAGRVVLVTRPAEQSAALGTLLRKRGATAILAPSIEIVPARSARLTRALKELGDGTYD